IVLSDHGEEFWEHGGLGHGTSLFEEQIRVPFLVKLPGNAHAGETRDSLVEIVDIAPTILELLGLPPETQFQGQSLAAVFGGVWDDDRIVYSSLFLEQRAMRATESAELKYVVNLSTEEQTWYDLGADPLELDPLVIPPSRGGVLKEHAARIASSGSQGLHVLVTGSLESGREITGQLQAPEIGPFVLDYPAGNGEVHPTVDGVEFSIKLSSGGSSPTGLAEWQAASGEPNYADLKLELRPDQPVRLSLELDGAPITPSLVHVGQRGMHLSLEDTDLHPMQLLADSDTFDPIRLPRVLGVYIWYVPGPDQIAPEGLNPDVQQSLRALGYLQ
ncbi:MAG: sulfatase-like hydrolase/transferase, partial [Candidatus Hydrogenedentes bacterium]|nr:sulfatase-like hydrolase/transferase [Candidatus Hydrogenedentota bacterium]